MQISQRDVERYSEGHSSPPQVPHFVFHGKAVKSCAGCARVKPIEEFSKNASAWDGLSPRCTACRPAD